MSAVPSPAWLVSLPACMCAGVAQGTCDLPDGVFCGADPIGRPLGSGGGTVHLLQLAAQAAGEDLATWRSSRCSVVLHGGGQSRRLPAYAAVGKPFVPVPVFRWSMGQRLDQTLFDLQRAFVEDIVEKAPAGVELVIASGDVLLQGGLEDVDIPDADVVMVGMPARPEEARHFGVLFCDREHPGQLQYFLQKPSADTIRKHSEQCCYFVDCGLWLLQEKALNALLAACGWDARQQDIHPFDLYSAWGPCFGRTPAEQNPAVQALTVAVAPLPGGRFLHFGRTADVIDAVYELQNPANGGPRVQAQLHAPHPRQFIQNAAFSHPLGLDKQACIWVENACVPDTWQIHDHHMLTNIPRNQWSLNLPGGICLDMPPLAGGGRVIRLYGMEDSFRGAVSAEDTCWLGQSCRDWFAVRGISLDEAGIGAAADIQNTALFPVVGEDVDVAALVGWMLDASAYPQAKQWWLSLPRVSATDLLVQVDAGALLAERRARLHAILPLLAQRHAENMFFRLDLLHFSRLWQDAGLALAALPAWGPEVTTMQRMHGHMLRSQVARDCGQRDEAAAAEAAAFTTLRDQVLDPILADKLRPCCQLLEDQIVWGRSPARLDLAGGWTDTPPYCLENGGSVLNMAVTLNGQPPIQVFGRLLREPKLVIRSIDLGVSEELHTYEDVLQYQALGSGFAVARAAFALSGFLPAFCAESYPSLAHQLKAFGGGIELSMLAAIPKGSGLGTSSILAATLLGVLGDLAGLCWDSPGIARRTLALEQMLTSGGGWQDQIGGLYGGVKLIETQPGITQDPVLRWAPSSFFTQPAMESTLLLYYTGITRVARNILGEIVRGLFLNQRQRLKVIEAIGRHAQYFYQMLLQQDLAGFAAGLRESWRLNQALDPGTNVPEISRLIEGCGTALAGCKLTGAGGGGFLLMQASDADAAQWIQTYLRANPPNPRARFVDLSVSSEGLQITRS